MKINIVILDDHELMLDGLQHILQSTPKFHIVGAYTDIDKFLLCIENETIDIVVMDLMLKGMHGFELIKKIQNVQKNEIKIIIISGFYEEMLHKRALELGVKAFLKKEISYNELISCMINVNQGNHIIPDFIVNASHYSILSEIEKEVLKLLIKECTNENIAKQLFISRRTVETHVSNICKKLGVNSRIGAVREAIRLNLI